MILESEARLIVCRKVAFFSECFFISRKKIILEVQNVSLFMEVTFKDICCWSGMLMHHTTNSDYTCGEWGCLYLLSK